MQHNIISRARHALRRARERTESWRPSYLLAGTIALSLLLLVATVFTSKALIAANEDITANVMERRMRDDKTTISRVMSAHSQALLSSVGLINSVSVTPEVWSRFINSYQNDKAFPGMSAIGAARRIPEWQIPQFERQLSRQYERRIEVFPRSDGAYVEPITYIERRDGLSDQIIGLDIMAFEERREAALQSTIHNQVTLTDAVGLVDDPVLGTFETQSAFMMFAPYYQMGSNVSTAEQRRENVRGHAFIAFRTQFLFESIFENNNFEHTRLIIYEGEGEDREVLYASDTNYQGRRDEKASTTVQIFNKEFTMEYQYRIASVLSPVQRYAPLLALLFGLTMALALPALIYIVVRSRQSAMQLANDLEVKKAQDELLSLASHQLRTPATATKQYLGMVLQGFMGDITKQQSSFLQKAYDSNERQLRIINDILHVAKLDAGRIVPSKKEFDITAVVKSVIEDNTSELRKAQIKINRRLGRHTFIVADEYMVRMIVENLVSNAIKYTDAGGSIRLTAERTEKWYSLRVQDTGVGIAKKDLDRLFKQFSRIPNERSGQVSGSGVGLYLAQNLARLHGGEIMVQSKEGKGSTFTLRLPRKM